jgi:ribosome-associated translation inhibitor RaiA
MKEPRETIALQIQFRHMPKSHAIAQRVRQQVDRLRRLDVERAHCEVVIDETHHWHEGGEYKVTVRLTIPGEGQLVAHVSEESGTAEYLSSAVRVAFEDVERQLKKQRRKGARRSAAAVAASAFLLNCEPVVRWAEQARW